MHVLQVLPRCHVHSQDTCHTLLDATSLDVPQAIGRYIVGRATGYWTLHRWTCHRLLALPRCHVHSKDTCHRLLDAISLDVPQAIGLTSLPCSFPRRQHVPQAIGHYIVGRATGYWSYLAAMFIPKTPARATGYWTLHRWTCHRLLAAISLDMPQAIARYIVGRATGYWSYLAAMFTPKTQAREAR